MSLAKVNSQVFTGSVEVKRKKKLIDLDRVREKFVYK